MTLEQQKETAAKIIQLLDGLPIWCAELILHEAENMLSRRAIINATSPQDLINEISGSLARVMTEYSKRCDIL